jgi:ferredoxin-nitrite reductase
VRVFTDHGNRADRTKARLKYVLDGLGLGKFLALVEEKLGAKLARIPPDALAPRPAFDRQAHVGVHAQKQPGLHWIGVVLPVGKLTAAQMRGLAAIARESGDDDIRLTVWQNLLISGVPSEKILRAEAAIAALGLSTSATSIRAGLVACTGNVGCRFSASDTKRHAEEIAQWCEARVALDGPVNIHLTGCHHSCAQHYIGDIGLIGARVPVSEDDTAEGYHVHVGGGFGPDAALGREIFRDVKAQDAPKLVERMLRVYLARRTAADETFLAFTRRHDAEELKAMVEAEAA